MPDGLKILWGGVLNFIKSWYIHAVLLVLLAIVVLRAEWIVGGWEWLRTFDETKESNSNTLRNVALIVAGVFALGFAWWRARIADTQSRTAQREADTARSGLLNERYQKGAEMLSSNTLATRMGGIYALQRLAEEHPEEYHVQIMRLLCAYIRHPTSEGIESGGAIRDDVQSAIYAIRGCRKHKIALDLEQAEDFRLDLTGAQLHRTDLSEINLSNADLRLADLSRAYLGRAVLSRAYLYEANLAGATLAGTDMTEANLSGARLTADSAADMIPLAGLTQEQLDSACADLNNPPILGAFDSIDSKRLVWYDRPCQPGGLIPDFLERTESQ